jgi:hypothetical protein
MSEGYGVLPRWLRGILTANEIAVYVAISSRHSPQGSVFPSHKLIAEDAGMSPATAKRTLARLKEKELVSWSNRSRKDRGKTSNVYSFTTTSPLSWRPCDSSMDDKEGCKGQPRPHSAKGDCLAAHHRKKKDGETHGSERAMGSLTGSDEVLHRKDASKALNEGSTNKPINRGQRERSPFDVGGLVREIEDDDDATGWLGGNNGWGSTEEFVDAAYHVVKTNSSIKDSDAWLAEALKHMSPVSKCERLSRLLGGVDDE